MRKHQLGGLIIGTVALVGCTPVYLTTAPGAAMPGFIAACNAHDAVGRCTDWSNKTDQCVNPSGATEPPLVPCSSIKKSNKGE